MEQTLLNIENLKTYFYTDSGVVKAVDDVDLSIKAGTTLAIVGESGSGKSILASSIMQLIPQPPGKIVSGSIYFQNQDLLALPEKEMRQIRGNRITMIFQEPMTSLNPVFKIGRQVEDCLLYTSLPGSSNLGKIAFISIIMRSSSTLAVNSSSSSISSS